VVSISRFALIYIQKASANLIRFAEIFLWNLAEFQDIIPFRLRTASQFDGLSLLKPLALGLRIFDRILTA
jgi:hypothetical protein